MGMLISPQAEIEAIRFVPFKSRAMKAEKVVCIDNTIIVRLNATTAASNRVNNFAYLPGHHNMDQVVTGLYRLGMISPDAMNAHLSLCADRRRQSDCEYAAKGVVSGAKTLGITLTKAQLRKVEAVHP